MACNGCTKRFGLFLKEHGCPACKYSFCSKCLMFRIIINGKFKDVCLRCYELSRSKPNDQISKQQTQSPSILDNPVKFPNTEDYIKPSVKPEPVRTTPDGDESIRRRLAALKQKNEDADRETNSTGTTVTDIEKRLATLKGVEYNDYTEANKKFLMQKDNRTEEEQITDLMKQFAEEQEIHGAMCDYRLAAVDDIEKRLGVLRDVPSGAEGGHHNKPNHITQPRSSDSEQDEENDEEAARKLTTRFLEEAAIDAKKDVKDEEDELNNLDIPTPLDLSETEELPWCTICNEDATIRCIGCDGDLFCRGCFKECHDDDEDYRQHETKPYKANHKGRN